MSSNDGSEYEPLSSPASPIQPMTDWSNTQPQQQGGNGILHGSLHELSPIWPDDVIGETMSTTEPDSPDQQAASPSSAAPAPSNRFVISQLAAAVDNKKQKLESTADSTSTSANGTFCPVESFVEKTPLELPTKTRLKVRIKRLKMVGGWRWVDGGKEEDVCGICRTSFETCCMECQFPGDECPLVLGQCKHSFHMHCIVKWTSAQNGQKPVCPLCRQEWKFATN